MDINFPPNMGQMLQIESPLNIPGIGPLNLNQEQTVKNLINIIGTEIQNQTEKSLSEKHFASDGEFTKILNDVGITDPGDTAAIFKYVKEITGYEQSETPILPEQKSSSVFTIAQEMSSTTQEPQQSTPSVTITNLYGKYPGLEGNVTNLIKILGMDISNKADNATLEKHFASDGDFTKILKGLGIKDSEIETIFSYIKAQSGNTIPLTPLQPANPNQPLTPLQPANPDQPSVNITNLYGKYPGLEGNVTNLIKILGMDISNKVDNATLEKHFASDGDFTKILKGLGIKDSEIEIIFNYIKAQSGNTIPLTPLQPANPNQPLTPLQPANPDQPITPVQPVTPPDQSLNLPDGLSEGQKAMIHQIKMGMASDKTNYDNSLANYNKLGTTPDKTYVFKQQAQQNMDAQFAAGPPPGARRAALLSTGLEGPQLTQTINYLMHQAGFYPPVDDLGVYFREELTSWVNVPGRTAGEKQFAAEMLKLIQPGMTDSQIQSTLNKFLGEKGDKDIFTVFGIDPKNFQTLSAMLPSMHITFPIPTDRENAYVQSYKLGESSGKAVRSALDQFPNDFPGFQAYVRSTILPNAPAQDQALIRELSGNQPTNQNLPPTRPDGSALFTYVNNSSVPDSQVYIQVIGVNPNTGNQCFIQYDRNGDPHYIDAKPGMDSQKYAFPLSYFNKSADGKGGSYYLPSLNGGRLYTSIGEPLKFSIDPGGGIMNPNPHQLDDPNNAIRWDKIEFTTEPYHDQSRQGMVFLNSTAVDNVTLPVLVSVQRTDGSVHQGGLTQGVYDQLADRLKGLGDPWAGLIQGNTVLSVMDAASTGHFPQDFFDKPQQGQTQSWIDGFNEKFSTNPLQISTNDSITPGDNGKGVWSGLVDPKTHAMVFTKTPPGQPSPPAINQVTITIPNKTSELLSGTGDGWNMGSVQKLTNQLCNLGIASTPNLVNGNWIPAFSDEKIQQIINGLPDSNPNKAGLQQTYREMKVQINLARDLSVGICTNTIGAKSDQVLNNRLCQLAQDGQIPSDILNGRKQVEGNWIPLLSNDQVKETINGLPDSNPNKQHLQLLLGIMSTPDAPLCQDTFTGAFQTSYANNPNMPAYAQFIDPVAAIVAANAVKEKGHEGDRLGNIYTHSYTDSTGHEGAANATPSEFQSGFIALGNSGAQTSWTS
jgi:hypothetical protein